MSPEASGSGPVIHGAKGVLSSSRTYFREMYPPIPRLVLAVVYFYAVYLGLAAYHGDPVALVAPVPIAGTLTYFFFLLFLRLSDELKDSRADRVHFPHRCVPSGRVSLAWVRGMWGAALAILFLLQIPAGGWTPGFLLVMGYGLLMYRYFFLRRWIAPSLILALVTHNPVGFLLHLYAVSLFSVETGHAWLEPFHVALALMLWLPAVVWEVARKIRAPTEETEYQTYSGILGPRRAVTLAAILAAAFGALSLVLAGPVGLGPVGRGVMALAAFAFVSRCVWFAANPVPERARLRGAAELWVLASLAAWCLDLLVSHWELWRPG